MPIKGKGSKHKNVGRIFQSNYFVKYLTITRFVSDEEWYFTASGFNGKEFKAGTPLSYFEKNNLEVSHPDTVK